MSKTLTEVAREAAQLPATERLELARMMLELSDSKDQPAPEIQDAWDGEIARRLGELRSGRVKGVPLEDVKKNIEGRFKS